MHQIILMRTTAEDSLHSSEIAWEVGFVSDLIQSCLKASMSHSRPSLITDHFNGPRVRLLAYQWWEVVNYFVVN